MVEGAISELVGPSGDTWNLPDEEAKRQAVASLRGYAYQLHRSVSEWLRLRGTEYLYLEAAEDYTTISRDPASLEEVLAATQVKDTRESGSVTLNSEDVLDAIRNYWRHQQANEGRKVRLTFLTTSPIGRERRNNLPSGKAGLDQWRNVSRGSRGLQELRDALVIRLGEEGSLGQFLHESADAELGDRLIRPITWLCGEPEYSDVVERNKEDAVAFGIELGGAAEQSERVVDKLIHEVLNTIILDEDRRLTFAHLAKLFEEANTVRVPITRLASVGVDLQATGAWVASDLCLPVKLANRSNSVAKVMANFSDRRRLWLHGANGMGKSSLAALAAQTQGGMWQALRLRGTSASTASERMIAARAEIGRKRNLTGLVLDDLNVDHETGTLNALRALGTTLSREGIACIITSNNPPGQNLKEALGIGATDLRVAPEFDEDDCAELVAQYQGSPATWARFVKFTGGFGHPQLVHAVVAGLAARGWREDEMASWMVSGFNSEDVSAERQSARRRLIDELTKDELAHLGRLARINGAFDKEVSDAVAQVEPPIVMSSVIVEKLSGYWIERSSENRFRVSPLVSDLANHILDSDSISKIDRAIGRAIILRQPLSGDLLDTGFMHAMLAKDDTALTRLSLGLTQAPEDVLNALAGAMPIFRDHFVNLQGGAHTPGMYVTLVLSIGRHKLIVTQGNRKEINESAKYVLAAADKVDGKDGELPARFMALAEILHPQESLGNIDGWFDLLRQFDDVPVDVPELRELLAKSVAEFEMDPVDFLFTAHALHLPDMAALAALFEELDELGPEARDRWIQALKHEKPWSMLVVDNGWFRESQSDSFDWESASVIYTRLATIALSWGETEIAARCFRNQAVLLDEYGHDEARAIAALDEAETRLPQNLDLVRERAKIDWRAGRYEATLDGLAQVEEWLNAGDAIDAAFAFREAAMSAAELDRWQDSQSYFGKAHNVLLKASIDQEAFKLGLLIDSVGARYLSGDTKGAIREMVDLVDKLAKLGQGTSPADRAVAVLGRHFVLWLSSQRRPNIRVESQPVRYFVGAISNPSPHAELQSRPIPEPATLWFLFGLVALDEEIPWAEIASWGGVQDLMNHADLYAQLPMGRLERSVANADADEFRAAAKNAAAAFSYFAEARKVDPHPDLLSPLKISIPSYAHDVFSNEAVLAYMRDGVLALTFTQLISLLVLNSAVRPTENAKILHDFEGENLVPQFNDFTSAMEFGL